MSFVYADEVPIKTAFGPYEAPVVSGGAFYALVLTSTGLPVEPANVRALIDFGMAVRHAVEARLEDVHPLVPGSHGMYGTIITL